ncbi:MAG: ankyrin repeat domain-containing protein [Kiritimatiellia bacterium]
MRLPGAGIWLSAEGREPPLSLSNQRKDNQTPLDPAVDFEFTGLSAGIYRLEGVSDRVQPVEIELKEGQMRQDEVRVSVCREHDLGGRIWFAVMNDRADEARNLLELGANPNPDEPGKSLLSLAAAHAGLDMVRLLAAAGAAVCPSPEPESRAKMREPNPDYARVNGLTPYENALWRGKTETAQFLLERGAQTNDLIVPPPGAVRGSVVDEDGQPIERLQVDLTRAVAPGAPVRKSAWTDAQGAFFFPALEPCAWNIHIPGLALNEFGPVALTSEAPTADLPPLRVSRRVLGTQKLLGHALMLLSADEIRALVAEGADVDCAGDGGRTPLMRVAQWGTLDAVRALAEAGAVLDAENDDGLTAMDLAVLRDRKDVVAYLREKGARPSGLPPPPPGRVGGVLLDEKDRPLPRIPLQCSAGEEAKLLDPLAFTGSDGSFLFVRLEPGEYDVRLFSTPGILLSATLAEPDFAVTNAVLRCAREAALDVALGLHLQVDSPHVAEVLKAGANANRTNGLGQTALMIAMENGYPKAVQALLEAGAQVNAADPEGATALHVACQRGDTNAAARLIAAGAKLDATNRAGRTPLDVAVWEGREEAAQQLRALGAPGSVAESKAMGALCGTVRDDAGAPISSASVLCTRVGDEIHGRYGNMTDRDGRYRIGRLPLGTYEVQLGFGDEDRKTVVLSNRDETVQGVDFRRPGSGDADWKLLHDSSFLDGSVARRLKEGADPNARDPDDGQTALHRAASDPQPRDVQILLNAGADVDATNRWGQTALMIAAESGRSGSVERLLKAGADAGRIDYNGRSALHLACKNGNRNAVKMLIEAGADLQQTNHWGRTPLDEAVWENRPEVAAALRAKGAPGTVTAPKPSGTIRGIAVDEHGAPLQNVVLQVQRQSGGTNDSGGHAELRMEADGSFHMWGLPAGCYRFASASQLENPMVICLTNDWDVQKDVRVSVPRRCVQEAALFAAVADDDSDAAGRLLTAGADPRGVDGDNVSLLEMALSQWATNVVPVLLAHGADLNAPNADGYTPLRRAVRDWSSWKIPYLLRLGAAVRPEQGGSPLLMIDVVRRDPGEDEDKLRFRLRHLNRCAKTARLLIGAGAPVDVHDEDGQTPLHYAALNGYAECAKILLKAGADLNATNAAGQTALDLAVAHGQTHVAAVLRDCAAAD